MDIKIYSEFIIILIILLTFMAIYFVYIEIKNDKKFKIKYNALIQLQKKMDKYMEKSVIRLQNATEEEKQSQLYKEELEAYTEYIKIINEIKEKKIFKDLND